MLMMFLRGALVDGVPTKPAAALHLLLHYCISYMKEGREGDGCIIIGDKRYGKIASTSYINTTIYVYTEEGVCM